MVQPWEGDVNYFQKANGLLVAGFNPFEKYARQNGNLPPIFGVKIKNIWNHHLAFVCHEKNWNYTVVFSNSNRRNFHQIRVSSQRFSRAPGEADSLKSACLFSSDYYYLGKWNYNIIPKPELRSISLQSQKPFAAIPNRWNVSRWEICLVLSSDFTCHWFCPHTLGRYPRLPQTTPKKKEIPKQKLLV